MTAVRIVRLAAGGDGVGQPGGRPHRVRAAHRAGRSGRAELGSRATGVSRGRGPAGWWSPDRDGSSRDVPTTTRDECGGCQLQHLDAAAQREARRGVRGRRASPARPARRGRSRAGRRRSRSSSTAPRSRWRSTRRGGASGSTRSIGPSEMFDLVRCHIAARRADGAVERAARHAQLLLPRSRQMVLRLDRGGGTSPGAGRRGSGGWSGAEALHQASASAGSRSDDLGAARGGAADAVAGAARCLSGHGVRAGATRRWATRCGPSRSRRWVRSADATCGICTPASARPPPPSFAPELQSRASSPIRARWPRRRRRGPAALRHVGRVEEAVGAAAPARRWSSPIRRAPAWMQRVAEPWSALAPTGSSTSPAIRRRWPAI